MRMPRFLALVIAMIGLLAACEQKVTHIEHDKGITGVNISVISTVINQCTAPITITVTVQGSGEFDRTATLSVSSGTLTKTGENTWTWMPVNGNHTFTATAAGDPTKTTTVSVTVNCGQAATDVKLQGNPLSVIQGQASTLSWGAANVKVCSALAVPATSEWSGARAFNGNQPVHPSVRTTYYLNCTGLDDKPYSAQVTIDVTVPGGITIEPTSLSIYPSGCTAGGTSGTLTARSGGQLISVAWEVLNPTNPPIVSVNPTSGSSTTVTGHNPGSATVRATGPNGQTATATVTVNTCPSGPGVTRVTVSPKTATIYPSTCSSLGSSTVQLTVEVVVTGGASRAVTWESNNTSIARVSSSGLVTAVAPGTTTITVRSVADPSKFDVMTITVGNCPQALILLFSASPNSITRGESSTLSWSTQGADSCTASGGWSGSRSVSGTLVVTPQSTTDYVMKCFGQGTSVEKTVRVVVNDAPTVVSVTIQPDSSSCSVGGQLNFGANVTVTGNASTGVTWSSSDPSIASVHQTAGNSATFNCHRTGRVTITARSNFDNTKSDNAIGKVVPGTMTCTWTPASGLQPNGDVIIARTTIGITATCVNEHGQSFLPYYHSSNPERVGVQGRQQVVIRGTTYWAGNNATLTGVSTGESLVCVQAAIEEVSPSFCRKVIVQ